MILDAPVPGMEKHAPITHVLLKDGRMGVVRLSRTAIKHCKRVDANVDIVIGDVKEMIKARSIDDFVNVRSGMMAV
jgi:hypothetical protein